MEITREQFYERMREHGISDDDLIESMYKRANKGAPKKRGGNPAAGIDRPKKYIGRFEFEEICATCGSKTKRRMIMEINPNKPREAIVYVNICNGCIPNYERMTKEELIALVVIKDHPCVEFRTLSSKQQIKLARSGKTAREFLNTRLEPEPAEDNRYLKPQYD